MSLGNTFTHAIVREIGRNYGKVISNSLLGGLHATPISITSSSINNSRGYKYETKLDEYMQKLEVRGINATFNQGQNIYNAFFELVSEAWDDGRISLYEISYLSEKIIDATKSLTKIEEALKELGANDKATIIIQKQADLYEFLNELDENFNLNDHMVRPFTPIEKMSFLYSIFQFDRILLFPKSFNSYFWLLLGIFMAYLNIFVFPNSYTYLIFSLFYAVLINPVFKGGCWKILQIKKYEKEVFRIAKELKENLKYVLKK